MIFGLPLDSPGSIAVIASGSGSILVFLIVLVTMLCYSTNQCIYIQRYLWKSNVPKVYILDDDIEVPHPEEKSSHVENHDEMGDVLDLHDINPSPQIKGRMNSVEVSNPISPYKMITNRVSPIITPAPKSEKEWDWYEMDSDDDLKCDKSPKRYTSIF